MARALPSNAWRDPARVLQEREEKTCVGCIFELKSAYSDRRFCGKLMPYGKRCVFYGDRQG